jgi:hypothetical protein
LSVKPLMALMTDESIMGLISWIFHSYSLPNTLLRTYGTSRVSAVDNFDLPLMAFGGKLGRLHILAEILTNRLPFLWDVFPFSSSQPVI